MSAEPGDHAIEALFTEERRYPPAPEFTAQANAQPELYELDFEELWAREAQRVTWFEPWTKLLEWEPPYAKWYLGGKLNACFNCVDRHVLAGKGEKVAYHWEGEPEDDRRELTFADLQTRSSGRERLKELGVRKGTPVGIYMGMIPQPARRDARLRAAGRAAHRCLRRVFAESWPIASTTWAARC